MRPIDADAIDWTLIEEEYGARTPAVVACQSLIQNAPTIDPVRHGYWKETDDPMFRACSVCGYLEWVGLWNNYCPECGAKMDGGEECQQIQK